MTILRSLTWHEKPTSACAARWGLSNKNSLARRASTAPERRPHHLRAEQASTVFQSFHCARVATDIGLQAI